MSKPENDIKTVLIDPREDAIRRERARIANALIQTLNRIKPVKGEATFVLLALVTQAAVQEGIDPRAVAALSLLEICGLDSAMAIEMIDAVARRVEDAATAAADTEPAPPAEPLIKLA